MSTYEPHSLSKVSEGTKAQLLRVYFDIEIGLSVNVLDLVDPWLQFSVFEDGKGITG